MTLAAAAAAAAAAVSGVGQGIQPQQAQVRCVAAHALSRHTHEASSTPLLQVSATCQ
jgi:hypothetical protein